MSLLIAPSTEEPLEYHTNPRHDLLPFLPSSIKRALDVGCGAGSFGVLLKQRYQAEVWGLERDESTAERARLCLDEVRVGDATQQLSSLDDGSFDFMSCNDVLEHMADPCRFLELARAKLTDDAVVVARAKLAFAPNLMAFLKMRTRASFSA